MTFRYLKAICLQRSWLIVILAALPGSILAQCSGFPATTADGNCGTGSQLANGANINGGANFYFCGSSNATQNFTGINLSGGTLRICGNANISGVFNSGVIVVSCGSKVGFPSGILLNNSVGIVNYGTITVTGDITFQNSNNYVYNENWNSSITVSGNITYPSNNGQNAYLKNSGYIKVNGNFSAYEGGFTCFNDGGKMEVNNILVNNNCGSGVNNRFTFGSSSGSAVLRYITHSALKGNFTASPYWTVYQNTGSTQTLSCGSTWGSATVTASGTAIAAPATPQGCSVFNCFTLPASIVSFTGLRQNNSITLTWTLAQVSKTESFTVERSADGLSWAPLLSATDTSGGIFRQYDPEPFYGRNYYRLKQSAVDESTAYSQVVVVDNNSSSNRLSVYPNPVRAGKAIVFGFTADAAGTASVTLTDVYGRVVVRKDIRLNAGVNQFSLEAGEGMYVAVLQGADGKVYSKSVIVTQ